MAEAWKQWEGQVVDGKFQLGRWLGGSDHSAVFLTQHGEPQPHKAAIKLIAADPATAEQQLACWRVAAEPVHSHLLGLLQIGRCTIEGTGVVYVVMEYAEEDLGQVLPQRPLTPAEVRSMLDPVLEALAYLHEKGFVHGGLKPSNVLAVQDRLKISSDKIRRVGARDEFPFTAGVHDPPEAGTSAPSCAGDVWSLGMTLVAVLTQRLPVWQGTAKQEPDLPASIPAPFLEIARNCLRRDPQLRWTIADIQKRVRLPAGPPQLQPLPDLRIPPKPPAVRMTASGSTSRNNFGVAVVIGVLILAAAVAAPRLLTHRTGKTQISSIPSTPKPAAVEGGQRQVQAEVSSHPPQSSAALPEGDDSAGIATAKQDGMDPPASSSRIQREPSRDISKGGEVSGEVAEQVLPEISQKARSTIKGAVRVTVRVQVNAEGEVEDASLDSPGRSAYFDGKAVEAAREWSFWPVKVDGHNAASQWLLRFEFYPAATKVYPQQVTP